MGKFECDTTLDPVIKKHLESLYAAADLKEQNDVWVAHFTEDAVLKKGVTEVKGHADLGALNLGSWEPQAFRQHIIYKVYPFGPSQDEVMLYGKSEYQFKDGTTGDGSWAARLHFKRVEDGVKIDFYQIYMSPKV